MAKVSVIIPTHNRAHMLKRAIESVCRQSFEDWELLIIDDGSTDTTQELVRPYLNEKIHYVFQDNCGVSVARNRGIEKARGEWIALLDSDDEWTKTKLEKQMDYLSQAPHLKVVHTQEQWIRHGKKVNQMKKHQKYGGWIFEKCLPLCLISPSSVMIHREVFERVGRFDPEFIVCEDYDLWLRMTLHFEVGYLEEALIYKYGGHEDQLSRRYKAMDYYRVKSIARLMDQIATKEVKEKAREVLLKKCEILLNGYMKHGKNHHYQEVSEIYHLNKKRP